MYSVNAKIASLLENFSANYNRDDVVKRHEVYAREMERHSRLPAANRIALAFDAFLGEKDVSVREDDLLAGRVQYYDYKDSVPVTMPDSFDPAVYPRAMFDVRREVANCRAHKTDMTADEEETLRSVVAAWEMRLFARWNSGHLICGFESLLAEGIPGLTSQCEALVRTLEDPERKSAAEAMLTTLRALRRYALRYADSAASMAKRTRNDAHRATLDRMRESLERIADRKPQSFFDAVQLVALAQDAIICENISGSISIGRIDQFLHPFYAADRAAGRITFEEAGDLLDALWLKFAGLVRGFQNVTLGGCGPDGEFAGNDLTLLCLRASGKIRKDQPLVSFRWHKDMPDRYWEEIADLVMTGLGFPALFNDEAVCRAKIGAGVEPGDAWRYGIVGCVEPSIPGLEYSNTEQLRVNWAIILGMMLDADGHAVPAREARDLDGIGSFTEFYEWYKRELTYFTELGMEGCDLLDQTYGLAWPTPLLSALTPDCIREGRDITRGALPYSLSSVNGCGMADAVDSLCAIEEFVFARKRMTLRECGEILKNDFLDHGIEHAMAVRFGEKFGNDTDKTNAMMKDLTDCFVGTVSRRRNLYGNAFQAGLYSVDGHAVLGAATGALPSGRRKGRSLANALSPCQGADTLGPTAVMRSVASVDMGRLGNGMVLDLKFTPGFLESADRRARLRDLVRGYFDMGGMEVQFNVVGRETLVDAQANPEKHRNLIVRVSGFSAYFTTLDKVLQDEIIARTEYAVV